MKRFKADFLKFDGVMETFERVQDFLIEAETEKEAKQLLSKWFAIEKGSLKLKQY